MGTISALKEYISALNLSIPNLRINDIIDILIVAYVLYKVISIIKDTRAWTLFKGLLVIIFITIIAYIFEFNTVLWIISNTISVGIIALIIIFQPELRSALEKLGTSKLYSSLFSIEDSLKGDKINTKTIDEIVKSAKFLSDRRLGALMIIEKQVRLGEYENTGIKLNANITSELLINIFEKNTPLHDGAVIIRGNLITYATCYLPLSNNAAINKKYGTRHRAAIGITEVSDAIAIVVSEETGGISICMNGKLMPNISKEKLRNEIIECTRREKKKVDSNEDTRIKNALEDKILEEGRDE